MSYHWDNVGIPLIVILLVGGGFGGIFYSFVAGYVAQGSVITSTQYNAGTIKDGDTYTVIGYNITVEYHGYITTTTILCPLYPVGSNIPIVYGTGWWGVGSSISIGSLPNGCQTNGDNIN